MWNPLLTGGGREAAPWNAAVLPGYLAPVDPHSLDAFGKLGAIGSWLGGRPNTSWEPSAPAFRFRNARE